MSQNQTFPLQTNTQLNVAIQSLNKELDFQKRDINNFDIVFRPEWANLDENKSEILNSKSGDIIDNILEIKKLGVTHVLFYFPKIELAQLDEILEIFADKIIKQLS